MNYRLPGAPKGRSWSGPRKVLPEDLLSELRRNKRRKTTKALVLVSFALIFTSISILGIERVVGTQEDQSLLAKVRPLVDAGSAIELGDAALLLEEAVESGGGELVESALAFVRGQLALEYGKINELTEESWELIRDREDGDAVRARALEALYKGQLDRAGELVASIPAFSRSPEDELGQGRDSWIVGMLSLARNDRLQSLSEIGLEISDPNQVPLATARLVARLQLQMGNSHGAITTLIRTRSRNRGHLGLAADEALFHASLRQKLVGVADLTDQLLSRSEDLSPLDHAHALLARGVVDVLTDDRNTGMERIIRAWDSLPIWDSLSRRLALEMALEAGNDEAAQRWIDQAGLSEEDTAIFRAWTFLATGDVMKCLEVLSSQGQTHSRVALLQGLALVEQGRWEEAQPWLARAEKFYPNRVDVAVARARVEVQTGDSQTALRKLRVLAEDEGYAQRVWTGLGEAYLAESVGDGRRSVHPASRAKLLQSGQKALEKALDREHRPAEAMVRLAEIWDAKRAQAGHGDAATRALDFYKKAVATNNKLPRYQEYLALYLAQLGLRSQALELLSRILEKPGIKASTLVVSIRMAIESASSRSPDEEVTATDPIHYLDRWFELAEQKGVNDLNLRLERARRMALLGDSNQRVAARQMLEDLVHENPGDIDSRVLYARVLSNFGDKERASDTLRLSLRHIPKHSRGRIYVAWSKIEAVTGNPKRAIGHARIAWRLQREERRPALDLLDNAELATRLYLRAGKPKQSLYIARELTSILPFHVRAWILRARVQLRAGEPTLAIEAAKKAVAIDGKDSDAQEILGFSLMRVGRRDQAKTAFTTALELATNNAQRQQIEEFMRRL